MNHTEPVVATPLADATAWFDAETPGAFIVVEIKGIRCVCPCGCGSRFALSFVGHADSPRPAWTWDGDRARPTLSPSIRDLGGCKWHGFLTAGVWTPSADSGR